jgi:4-diphosphocytidyl-2C-methyl-D-erythritol kinase
MEDTKLISFLSSGQGELSALVENDFEATVCTLNPDVAEGLTLARSVFPHTTALTGSGSALFSLVPEGQESDMSVLSSVAQKRGYTIYRTCLIFD